MTQSNHTKGPWVNNGQGIICSSKGDVCTNVDNPDDAAIIAASPDLLEALVIAELHINHMAKWISKNNMGYSFESLSEDMSIFKNAIKKATS